jgi:hypothetical protein
MQRMLALPVEAPEEAACHSAEETAREKTPPEPTPGALELEVQPFVPQVHAVVTLAYAPVVPSPILARAEVLPEFQKGENQPLASQGPLPAAGGSATASAEASSDSRSWHRPRQSPAGKPLSQESAGRTAMRPSPDGPPAGWWLYLFLWCDRLFVGGTRWLGPVGRWLQGPWGRASFGLAGLCLLAAALAWVALGRLGWTW